MELTERTLTHLQVAMAPTQEEPTAAKSDHAEAASPKKKVRRKFQPAKSPRKSPKKRRKKAQMLDRSSQDEPADEEAVADANHNPAV